LVWGCGSLVCTSGRKGTESWYILSEHFLNTIHTISHQGTQTLHITTALIILWLRLLSDLSDIQNSVLNYWLHVWICGVICHKIVWCLCVANVRLV
jgi:hypothetical protein